MTYEEAMQSAAALKARDDDKIAAGGRTLLLERGKKQPWAVVLFHGLTNNPGQYREFAPQLAKLGCNVLAPRMPYHGYVDRITNDLSLLKAQDLKKAADEAVDIACGLGERVAVIGISMGGLQCAYLGQYRDDVAVSVPIAPDFGVLGLSHAVVEMLDWFLSVLPNGYFWWDPRAREAMRPLGAYPRFATKALLATLKIADEIYDVARKEIPKAKRITTVVNRADPAVSNEVTHQVVEAWKSRRPAGIDYVELTGLPENHDIIEPDNPLARTDLVYPKLIELLNLT